MQNYEFKHEYMQEENTLFWLIVNIIWAHGKFDWHQKHSLQCYGEGQPVEHKESRSSVLTWIDHAGRAGHLGAILKVLCALISVLWDIGHVPQMEIHRNI